MNICTSKFSILRRFWHLFLVKLKKYLCFTLNSSRQKKTVMRPGNIEDYEKCGAYFFFGTPYCTVYYNILYYCTVLYLLYCIWYISFATCNFLIFSFTELYFTILYCTVLYCIWYISFAKYTVLYLFGISHLQNVIFSYLLITNYRGKN